MCHVLIIEDDLAAAVGIRGALQALGPHTFSIADTERGAVLAAHAHRPDLITSDVMLGDGLGPSAVRSIEAEFGPVPTIFVTATPELCEGCPPGRVLSKPLSTQMLMETFIDLAPVV